MALGRRSIRAAGCRYRRDTWRPGCHPGASLITNLSRIRALTEVAMKQSVRPVGRPSLHPDESLVKFGLAFRPAHLEALRQYAHEHGKSINGIVCGLVEEWVK